ncbi:Com family DNA-binding transcriptional regulator [Desulfurispira natronophila]|uniref:Com family DNA-binding transcriptional regulator n=1 Tax=Desulfurispira natronophila TaxID=682562 RepID=UPI001619CAD3
MEKSAPMSTCAQHGSGVEKVALQEARCRKCHRLLFKGFVIDIEVKCPKCGALQNFDYACQCRARHTTQS